MVCIYCGGETSVINSRLQKRENQTWRRRHCKNCEATFTTIEKVELVQAVTVRKQDALEPFSRDKLFLSVYESCKHRINALEAATALTDTILSKLLRHIEAATIDATAITEVTSGVLKNFDKAAMVHYRAYHP